MITNILRTPIVPTEFNGATIVSHLKRARLDTEYERAVLANLAERIAAIESASAGNYKPDVADEGDDE